jgi:thiol-disulfide isomerase/thioredoxin
VKRLSILLSGLVAIGISGCRSGGDVATTPGTAPAPKPASVTGATLDQAAKAAPAVLYFVATDCGSNPEAIPLVQSIYKANEDKGKFFVVMNANAENAAKWSKENKATFPIIPDPEMKIIKKYKVEFSQTGVLVDGALKETKRFPGYGRKSLEDLNKTLAGEGEPAKVDLSSAPEMGFG